MNIHEATRVSSTKEHEVEAFQMNHKHVARWFDGGLTQRSRRGSLVDTVIMKRAAEAQRMRASVARYDIENVDSFDYLGARLQCDGAADSDVIHRMAIAQTTCSSLTKIWTDRRLQSRTLKLRTFLYGFAVCSTLTHSAEVWSLARPPSGDTTAPHSLPRTRTLRMPESSTVRCALNTLSDGGTRISDYINYRGFGNLLF